MAAPSFVDVKNVSVKYTRPRRLFEHLLGTPAQENLALRHISFQTNSGDQRTLYGQSGAGKTTLLQVLVGAIKPTSGQVFINGTQSLKTNPHRAAGYISSEEPERHADTVHDVLYTFGKVHALPHLTERLTDILTVMKLDPISSRPAKTLAKTERLRLNIARAALSEAPLVLFDDVADDLGPAEFLAIADQLFSRRTFIIATRSATTAQALNLPILLLHGQTIAHCGTFDAIANNVGCQRIVEAWVEGVRYDLLRHLKQHPGVASVRLLPTSSFAGQQLRIILHSAHYLPALYDTLSKAPLIEVREVPPSLEEILDRL